MNKAINLNTVRKRLQKVAISCSDCKNSNFEVSFHFLIYKSNIINAGKVDDFFYNNNSLFFHLYSIISGVVKKKNCPNKNY